MITASLVLYKSKPQEVESVLDCVEKSVISNIFVIDNSPTDDLKGVVANHSSKATYLFGQGNIGYGEGNNIGIRRAIEIDSVYHVVLNPDIFFEPHVVENLRQYADRHSDIGLILPKVIYPNGDLQRLCKLLPTPMDIFGRRFFPEEMMKKRNNRFEMHQMGYDKTWNCPILSGCFMFMRVSDLKKAGGFDNRFFMYFEDFDLMRRLHKICKTVYFPNETIVHSHAAGHHTNKRLLKESIKSAIKYFNKWGWVFDKERRNINRNAFSEINLIKD